MSGFQTSEFVNLLNFCFGNGKLEYDNIKHIGKTMHKKETAATWCLLQTVQALASTLPASEQNREKGCAMILSLGSATSGSVSLHTICWSRCSSDQKLSRPNYSNKKALLIVNLLMMLMCRLLICVRSLLGHINLFHQGFHEGPPRLVVAWHVERKWPWGGKTCVNPAGDVTKWTEIYWDCYWVM